MLRHLSIRRRRCGIYSEQGADVCADLIQLGRVLIPDIFLPGMLLRGGRYAKLSREGTHFYGFIIRKECKYTKPAVTTVSATSAAAHGLGIEQDLVDRFTIIVDPFFIAFTGKMTAQDDIYVGGRLHELIPKLLAVIGVRQHNTS